MEEQRTGSARPADHDRSSVVVTDTSTCDACGSSALVETVIHDERSWTHQLVCRDCRHVLEAASSLGHEPSEAERAPQVTR